MSRTRIYYIPEKNQSTSGPEFIYLGRIKVLQVLSLYTSGESNYFRSWVYIQVSIKEHQVLSPGESKYFRSWAYIPGENQSTSGPEYIYLGRIKVLQILSLYTWGESKYFRSWVYIPGENQSTSGPEYIYLGRIKVLQILRIIHNINSFYSWSSWYTLLLTRHISLTQHRGQNF